MSVRRVLEACRQLARYGCATRRRVASQNLPTLSDFIICRVASDKKTDELLPASRRVVSTPPPIEEKILGQVPRKAPVIFPWRHEETTIPRITPGTVEYDTKGQLLSTTSMKPGNSLLNALVTAYMFLDVPWYQLILFGSWRTEFEESVAWAFTRGVSGIISSLYNVPFEKISRENYHIDCTLEVDNSADSGAENGESSESDAVASMIEEKLLAFYKSARESSKLEKFVIRLQMQAHQAEVISLYCIPYISRNNIKKNPGLLEKYRKMLEKRSIDRAPELSRLRGRYLNSGTMESTIIAQVLVWSSETFYVKDLSSGRVLQGEEQSDNAPAKKVPHLVRMEMKVKTKKEGRRFINEQENWEIVDIDDLLDGNLFV